MVNVKTVESEILNLRPAERPRFLRAISMVKLHAGYFGVLWPFAPFFQPGSFGMVADGRNRS